MQAKINIVLKLSTEIGMSVKVDSPLYSISNLNDNERLRLTNSELIEKYEINEVWLDEVLSQLNDIKKKYFEINILESGIKIESKIELKDLKSRGIEKLIKLPADVKREVNELEMQIYNEQAFLSGQRKKSKDTLVEENNLLPNLNFRVGVSLLLTLFASIFVILGYIASTDERFYDRDFGYWSMLLGSLAVLVTLNLLIIRIVQAIRFNINRQKVIVDLGTKYLVKLESDYEVLEGKLRSKIFSIESVVYSQACKDQLNVAKNEVKELKSKVSDHMK